jgi:hypothetical protein
MVSFDVLAPVVFAACLVLCASGGSKLRRPDAAVRALRASGLRGGPWTVRSLGVLEIAAGGAVLVAPARAGSLAVAALYLAFAVFLATALARGAETSCGCFGTRDLPPSWLHVSLDGLAAAAALGFAVLRPEPPGLFAFIARSPAEGLALAAGSALIAWLAAQVVLLVPAAFVSYRGRARAA